MSVIYNRLQKNFNNLKGWRKQHQIEAYRLYDRDIPEYPFIIDVYLEYFLIYDRRDETLDFNDKKSNHYDELLAALQSLFNPARDQIILKRRQRQKGDQQYERLDTREEFLIVQEGPAKFQVNLWDYLDTGLFLDHRPLRARIKKESKGAHFLNLFSYTGSVSVFAALGGALTTSVDMSPTYTDWARRNFELNQINFDGHEFINDNALEFLSGPVSKTFDIIFLDPPTFSNSKKMATDFDVERDQLSLLESTMRHLSSDGVLYFSNNKRGFKIDPKVLEQFSVTDISESTIPRDFRDTKIHKVFSIKQKI